MKPVNQLNRPGCSTSKGKKNVKERDKRKSQSENVCEKGSPEVSTCLYAGIDTDSLAIYAEQTVIEHLSEDVTNLLAEEINYKLRYIINDALIKGRLSGRNAISSSDLEETFDNLKIERIYGAPELPNWVPFGHQNFIYYYLDDSLVNLVEIAEGSQVYHQHLEPIITKKWVPNESSSSFEQFFQVMCQMVLDSDVKTRSLALKSIGDNSKIGLIIPWFYNFGFILLSKDLTYNSLTFRALALITALENSVNCRVFAKEEQLRFLTRLLLQRLLIPGNLEVLRDLCETLSVLCQRAPLREFVIIKLGQKTPGLFKTCALQILTLANSLGIDAICEIIIPMLSHFLHKIPDVPLLISPLLELYTNLFKRGFITGAMYEEFQEYLHPNEVVYGDFKCFSLPVVEKVREMNVVRVKFELLKTRRKICPKLKLSHSIPIEEIFDMSGAAVGTVLRRKMTEQKLDFSRFLNETDVIIGQTSLLLPVFKQKMAKFKCYDPRSLF